MLPRFASLLRASLLLAILLAGATPAAAHKLKVFATSDGQTISGTVFFGGNVPARGVPISVLDAHGRVVAMTESDEDGRFRAAMAGAFDHRIVAETADGHRSEFLVHRTDMPASAPALAPQATAVAPTQAADRVLSAAELDLLVEQAVARQLAPLREQLDAFEERVLWRDVLGGIGYIVGLVGLAAWLIARHRRVHGGTPAE